MRTKGRHRAAPGMVTIPVAALVILVLWILAAHHDAAAHTAPKEPSQATQGDGESKRAGRGRGRLRDQPKAEPDQAKVPQVSYLEIARRAVVAGDKARAAKALAEARACWQEHGTACGFVRIDYQALVGVVYLEHHDYAKAAKALAEVTREEPKRTVAWLYLGQALYHLERYPEALKALRKARSEGEKLQEYYALLARTEMAVDQPHDARKTLLEGLRRHPEDRALMRELTLLYTRYGLYRTAADIGRRYRSKAGDDTFAHLLIADALRNTGRAVEAIPLLEEALLRAPHDDEVLAHLAHAYAEADHPYAAARLFERLSWGKTRYAFEAAEQYRVLGRYGQALRLNHRVPDGNKRLRQRLAILLGSERYDRAVELAPAMARAGLMDDSARYQLGYAAVRARRLELAEGWLDGIKSATYAAGTARVKAVLHACRAKPWTCP